MSFVFRPPWRSPWQRPPLFPWTSSAATNADTSGASSLTFAPAGAGAAVADFAGTTTITFGGSGVGSGVSDGVGQTTITFSVSGDANLTGDGAGTSSITFATDAGGSSFADGLGATTITFGASGAGEGIAGGDGAGSCSFAFTVSGALSALVGGRGTSSITFAVTGVSDGSSIPNLTTQLEAIYRLDGDLTDSSGNGNDLTATSALTFGTGIQGQSLDDGSASLSSFVGMPTLAASNPFTLIGWFKSPGVGATGNQAVVRLNVGSTSAFIWAFGDGTNHGLGFYKGTATGQFILGDSDPDDWHFGAIVFPGTGAATGYFGNSSTIQTVSITNSGWTGGATGLVIGTTTDATSALDLVSVYSRALSNAEILNLWSAGAAFDPTAAVALAPGGVFRRAFWSWTRVAQWRPGVAIELEPVELTMTLSENRVWGFDFRTASEVYDGASVIDPMASGVFTPDPLTGLTFGSVSVISTAFDGIPVDAGLQAGITASATGTYDFAMKGTTTAGRVLVIPCRLTVVADYG